MTRKTGVYVCTGCSIGESVNKERLVEIAEREFNAAVIRTSPAFCLEDAQKISDDVAGDGIESVVIAACSQRVNTDVFAFDPATVERVNVREQVAWCHSPGTAATQQVADDQLRMGIVKGLKRRPPAPYTEVNERRVLVVGGGVTGLSAALDAARAGHDVTIVEKAAELGGFARHLHRQFPKAPPYDALAPSDVDGLIAETSAHPRIEIHTSAQVASVSGQPGSFRAAISRNGEIYSVAAGAIVLATGWKPVADERLAAYGLGSMKNVITTVMLEEMAAHGEIRRPSDGAPVNTVALLQVDRAEDEANIPYSGNVGSLVMLKQAVYLREDDPARHVYVVARDLHTPGQFEYFYRHAQQDERIFLTRAHDRAVTEDADGTLEITLDDTLLGGQVRIRADLLVLAVGMEPSAPDVQGLNLEYRQGGGMPVNRFGYADSNFICFPYETRRTGIYTAGCVRQPMDVAQSSRDGTAAALKAIQCIEQSSAGAAVHPRVGDLTYPNILTRHCTQCWRCTEECPFGALEVRDETRAPYVNPNRCRRCGICMGACPVQVISFADYSVDMLGSMIRAADLPKDDDSTPQILVLACENDAYPALDMAGINRRRFDAVARVIPVRCQGSVNRALVADALFKGFDAVALMGCKAGDDYQCHFIRGSELLDTRMANIREVMDRMALDADRVQFMEVTIAEFDKIPAMLDGLAETVRRLGPNPLRVPPE